MIRTVSIVVRCRVVMIYSDSETESFGKKAFFGILSSVLFISVTVSLKKKIILINFVQNVSLTENVKLL